MSIQAPKDFVQRVANGAITAADAEWLQRGFSAWLNGEGAVSLERCLRLPSTRGAIVRMVRDYWLIRAATRIETTGLWLGPVDLSKRLARFLERGQWRQWKKLQDPPAGADDDAVELFRVLKANGGRSLGAKQVQRIAGDAFRR